jgi:hypothetical protein
MRVEVSRNPYWNLFLGLAALTTILGLGCSDDEGSEPGSITLEFVHGAGTEDLVFDQFLYTTALGDVYSVETLRYYVSTFELGEPTAAPVPAGRRLEPLHGGGAEAIFNVVHYIDAREATTHTLVLESVPVGTYDTLTFDFGLNKMWNVTDTLGTDPEHLDMAWPEPMGGGYHYMKFEGKFIDTDSGDTLSYVVNTGRNGPIPHFFVVTRPLPDLSGFDSHRITVRMDLNEWFTGPNDIRIPSDPTMGNVALQDTLMENGESVLSVLDVETFSR